MTLRYLSEAAKTKHFCTRVSCSILQRVKINDFTSLYCSNLNRGKVGTLDWMFYHLWSGRLFPVKYSTQILLFQPDIWEEASGDWAQLWRPLRCPTLWHNITLDLASGYPLPASKDGHPCPNSPFNRWTYLKFRSQFCLPSPCQVGAMTKRWIF